MIIVVGGIKGGSGKSTIASNLAIMRAYEPKKVLLVDADAQASASDFTAQRNETKPKVQYVSIQLQNAGVRTEIQKMKDMYDDVIIDTGGRDSNSQRAGLSIADVMLIPFAPRSFDIWTLDKVKVLVEEAKSINDNLSVYAFINKADPKGTDNQDAKELLKEQDHLTYIDTSIGNRKAFANATAQGLSVVEVKSKSKDQKAIDEIKTLYNYIFKV